MRMRSCSLIVIASTILSAAAQNCSAQVRLMPSPITVMTRDSTIIHSDLYLPTDTAVAKFPLIVLLHALGKDRTSYEHFVPLLLAQNMAVLNIDLRGHGKSAFVRRQVRTAAQLETIDFRMMPGDLLQLLAVFGEKWPRLDLTRLGIVGASIGSTAGAFYAADHTEVRALVMISPGLDYRHLNTEAQIVKYSRRPLLLMTGKYDMYSYRSANTLYDAALGEKILKIYDTSKHGTELFQAAPGSDSLIVNWLQTHL